MKIGTKSRQSGTILVVAIFTIMVISIVLASYLTLVTTESRAVSRSQTWNNCLPVMEAGVEEALAHIRASGPPTNLNLALDNWTLGTNGFYEKTRPVGTDGSYCVVSIDPVIPPVIYSSAYIPVVMADSKYISRKVRVGTMTQTDGMGGLIAKTTITLKGGGFLDSYNSWKGPWDPTRPGTNAIALTVGTNAAAVNMSGGNIFGMAVTGPGGTVSTSGGAAVGDEAWNATQLGVQPGWSANDANVQINDNPVPNTSGWIGSIFGGQLGGVGTNYSYVLNGANYYISGGLNLQNNEAMAVTGNSTLYIMGDVNITGNAFIYVAPGAKLTLYLGGKGKFGGGSIVNASAIPSNLNILGLPTCTSIDMNGGSAFYGVVNAPQADFNYGAGSDAFGQFTAKSILIGGHGSVHYDRALGNIQMIVAANWNEL